MNDPKQIEKLYKLIAAGEGFNPNSPLGSMMVETQALTKKFAVISFFGAVEKRELDMIKTFVEKGEIDINVKNLVPQGLILTRPTTALGIAIAQGNSEEVIKYLLANGADPKLAFDDFKKSANIDGINQLIKIAPDSVPQEVHESKQLATHRLFAAIKKGDLSTIKSLIEKKLVDLVDINAKETFLYNTTPLNFAINQENNEEVIKYLLANGANPRLALVDIIEAGNNNALNLLMKVAPSITVDEVFPQVMAMGMRRFFQAVQNKDLSAIKDFIEKGIVDINAKSPINGKTALDIAVNQENNEEIIDYLLANGAKDDTIEPLGIVNPEE